MPVKWQYIVSLILFIGASFYFFYPRIENFFVFFPESKFYTTPEDQHLNHKEVYFHTEDGKRLHGWFFPLKEEFPVVLFCHGNAGNISHRLDNVRLLLAKNLQVFIFDYRGFGKSSGRPSEKGIYMDGLAAHDYLVEKEHLTSGNIIPFGRSLGAAVAIEVALKKKVRSVIIESAFTSTKDMAKTMFLFALFSPILPSHYDNLGKIPGLNVPKLIIHGEDDEIVPFSMGQRLFDRSEALKFFFPLKGAGHNDTYIIGGEKYFQTIATFAKDSKIIAQPQRH